MKKVIIITGNHLRHDFIRKAIALFDDITVLRSYCETKAEILPQAEDTALSKYHLDMRLLSEKDFFQAFVTLAPDHSNPVFIESGEINQPHIIQEIISLKPDVLIAYGCSLVKGELLELFKGRFFNVHLGLSPYYRGTATNFWPLVNGEPEFVGATFMHIDQGIDTGEIVHQIRADIYPEDSPHQIGNRLITQIPAVYRKIIFGHETIKQQAQMPLIGEGRYYRRKDFSEEATRILYENFKDGMIERYLNEKTDRHQKAPIVINPLLI